jgi:RNA polymerase sigma-70 factor, ECF subfamily
MQHPLDRVLVATFLASRDENVFKLLYKRHHTALWRLALRMSGDQQDAQDLVQEAWIRAMERLPEFQWRASLRTWLSGFVVHLWREKYRRQRFAQNLFAASEAAESMHFATPDLDTVMDVQAAIRELPDGYRALLVLHDMEGFKHDEIAQMLGISTGTCKSQLHHARKAFREMMTQL